MRIAISCSCGSIVNQVAAAPLQPDGGRVAADVLVEVVEVVLGLLESIDQAERVGEGKMRQRGRIQHDGDENQ